MIKVITYGTFDLFHQGHYNLLKRAKELGDYLIVGVTTDNFDLERGKMNTSQDVMARVEAVRATGLADKIIIEEYAGQKIDDIQKYGINCFAIGSDWEGKFDYLREYCEVIYLPRTEGVSSTQIRNRRRTITTGIIGTGSIAERFVKECVFVNGVVISGAYNPNKSLCEQFCTEYKIPRTCNNCDELFATCDAVYIASPPHTHYNYTKLALLAGKHVLCETPFVFKEHEAKELYSLAEKKGLRLMVALKTAFCPSFSHLISLLKTGVIGEIVEINASVTTLTDAKSPKLDSNLLGGSISENACFPLLPIFKFFGTDYININFYSRIENKVDLFTKAVFRYNKGVASFQVGLGVKSEGNLIISGTKGYAYVPAPWWKTDYFELRFEDNNKNKKFFYPFDGEGLRYEIKAFISSIVADVDFNSRLSKKENIAMARVQEQYVNKVNFYTI